jgi:ketosteroid isomerase-like protein
LLISNIETSIANNHKTNGLTKIESQKDSVRIAELDRYWTELARTVKEGDFEGYGATYHKDAVVVFATGKNKTSVALSKALAGWKDGFMKTKEGKQIDAVQFRFSQRIGDETTAHETGIFRFTSKDANGNLLAEYSFHFEMLLIKREDKWYGLMEHQKSAATEEEWQALK